MYTMESFHNGREVRKAADSFARNSAPGANQFSHLGVRDLKQRLVESRLVEVAIGIANSLTHLPTQKAIDVGERQFNSWLSRINEVVYDEWQDEKRARRVGSVEDSYYL